MKGTGVKTEIGVIIDETNREVQVYRTIAADLTRHQNERHQTTIQLNGRSRMIC